MNKVSKITESDIRFISELIYESNVDVSSFDNVDRYLAFVEVFRNWYREKYGKKGLNYPLSYLLSKYMNQFISDFDIQELPRHAKVNLNSMIQYVGTELLKSEKYKFDLDYKYQHTKKHKKLWDIAIKKLNLPSFITYELTEESPFNVRFVINYDFETLLKSDFMFKPAGTTTDNRFSTNAVDMFLTNFLSKYGGVKFGNPIQSEIRLTVINSSGSAEIWTDNYFNKKIKSKLRESEIIRERVRSFKFEYENYRRGPSIISYLKNDYRSRYTSSDVENEIKRIITEMGYNPKQISVYQK
jgi:hypothetical protein